MKYEYALHSIAFYCGLFPINFAETIGSRLQQFLQSIIYMATK